MAVLCPAQTGSCLAPPRPHSQDDDPECPWSDEIEQKVFQPPPLGVADYVSLTEVAFFHKATR